MLKILVPAVELFDDSVQEFVTQGDELELEHSLVAVSKWEAEFEKPFLGKDDRTTEEAIAYVKAMTLTPNVPEEVYLRLSEANVEEINRYTNRKMTATWFSDPPGAPQSREIITADLIYYWMTVFQIDWEAQYWHLNRLFTLIRVCNIKQAKPKKMSRSEIAERNRRLNAERRAQLGSTG